MKISLKKILFPAIIVILPFFLILLMEVFFNILGQGYDTSLFKVSEKGLVTDNPGVLKKYYPQMTWGSEDKNYSINLFSLKKQPNVKRIFILGESTAQGYPYFEGLSFGKILEGVYNLNSKNEKIEVINLGFSALNSFAFADISSKISAYSPDYVIFYGGHNEIVGTYGYSDKPSWLKNLELGLKELKVFQLLFKTFETQSSSRQQTLMSEQMENLKNSKAIDYENVITDYKSNLKIITENVKKAGAKLIVMSPASNIIDFPPFDSNVNLKKQFEPLLRALETNHTDFKNLCNLLEQKQDSIIHVSFYKYLKGLVEFQDSGNIQLLQLARDADTILFRARTALINYILLNKEEDFISFDTEKALYKYKTEDSSVFSDHLHFNFLGNKVVAFELANLLLKLENHDVKVETDPKDTKYDRSVFHYSPIWESFAQNSLKKLTNNEPYSSLLIKPKFFEKNMEQSDSLLSELEKKVLFDSNYNIHDFMDKIMIVSGFKGELNYFHKLLSDYTFFFPGYFKPRYLMAVFLESQNNVWAIRDYADASVLGSKNASPFFLLKAGIFAKKLKLDDWEKDQYIADPLSKERLEYYILK